MRVQVLPYRTRSEQEAALERTAGHLGDGGLIAHPTETVYGFGGALDPEPLDALVQLKRRNRARPFLLLVADVDRVDGLVWNGAARALARAFWPGPLTLALRAEPGAFPAQVCGADGTVAVRVTGHDGMRMLLRVFGRPITSTSANIPGAEPATDPDAVRRVLQAVRHAGGMLLLDGGPLPASPPSTIVDCGTERPRVLREGAITTAELSNVVHDIAI